MRDQLRVSGDVNVQEVVGGKWFNADCDVVKTNSRLLSRKADPRTPRSFTRELYQLRVNPKLPLGSDPCGALAN